MKRVCIAGGGCSGALLAIYLMEKALPGTLDLTIVERTGRIGYGIAYSTDKSWHILNTPVSKMSLYEDNSSHFRNWLSSRGVEAEGGDFVQRKFFGDYLNENFQRAAESFTQGNTLKVITGSISNITRHNGYFRVARESGEIFYADTAVIASGYNGMAGSCGLLDILEPAGKDVFYDPWSLTENSISPDENVLILGTGLTMIDKCLDLYYGGHKGAICALSPHGRLPNIHDKVQPYPSFYSQLKDEKSVADIFRIIKTHIKRAAGKGVSWVSVIESLRPHNSQIWASLPLKEKRTFFRHLKHIWNVSRHRMPQETAQVITKMTGSGKLKILKGRINEVKPGEKGYRVFYRNANKNGAVSADKIINCTGLNIAENCRETLLSRLFKGGLAAKDDLKIGLKTDADFNVINPYSHRTENLYALGPVLMGTIGESTSAVDIKQHAKYLSGVILDSIGVSERSREKVYH
jgi:uncharacterized NAD(P)/FAD-binding protein YdhS